MRGSPSLLGRGPRKRPVRSRDLRDRSGIYGSLRDLRVMSGCRTSTTSAPRTRLRRAASSVWPATGQRL